MHSDHLLAAVTQALTDLTVYVDKSLTLVEQEKTIRRVIDKAAKASLACAHFILCALALGDIAHQAQIPASALLKLVQANLHRERGAVLAPVAGLEGDGFPDDAALL